MDETTTTNQSQCAECGTEVPADAPLGICPACLLKRAMRATTAGLGAGRPSGGGGWHGGFDPPTVEQLIPLFPQLEILEFIGRGGMGAVYKARQPHLDRCVAVKILPTTIADDPAFAERFAREARSLARMNHANVVTVHDFGRAGEFFFFVMEYVDGLNLRQALLAKTLEPRQALAIVPQICDALQYAHDEGIVHRDIKPENVLLDKRGRVKIADFGLAKLLQKTPQNYTLTQTAVTMGTPHYMAPEQTERPLEVDHRADIYSLGVVFYEMLTGELPLGRFAAPSEKAPIDARLDEVVFKTLEKEPSRRYQQASEVKTSVQGLSTPPPLPPGVGARRPEPEPEPVLPYAQRHATRGVGADADAHYSRLAWAGAIWGALGAFGVLVPILLGAALGVGASILMMPFLFAAFTAFIGMPLCGLIAISQIHRSRGQITGLRLATFDALAVPVLLLNVIMVALPALVVTRTAQAMFIPSPVALGVVILILLPMCAIVDFFLVRTVWRWVRAGVPEGSPAVATAAGGNASRQTRVARARDAVSHGNDARFSRTAIAGALWATTGLFLPVGGLIIGGYAVQSQTRTTATVATPAPPLAVPPVMGIPGIAPPPAAPPATPPVPGTPGAVGTARGGGGSGGGGGARSGAVARGGSSAAGGGMRAPSTSPAQAQAQADTLAEVQRRNLQAMQQVEAATTAIEAARNRRQSTASSPPRASASARSGGGSGGGGANAYSVARAPARTPPVTPAPAAATTMVAPWALIFSPLLLLAVTAPVGATVLGLIAISQIRQSGGRLYGMPLALFDTLLFPLLLLDVLIVGLTIAVLARAGNAGDVQTAVASLIAFAAAIWADVWVVRRVRDAADTPPAEAPAFPITASS